MSELANPFDSSLPAVTEHLEILERAGLITRGGEAQWRPCRLEARPLGDASHWIDRCRRFWEQHLDRLGGYLRETQPKEPR